MMTSGLLCLSYSVWCVYKDTSGEVHLWSGLLRNPGHEEGERKVGGRRREEEEEGGERRRGKELEEALQTVTHDL